MVSLNTYLFRYVFFISKQATFVALNHDVATCHSHSAYSIRAVSSEQTDIHLHLAPLAYNHNSSNNISSGQ